MKFRVWHKASQRFTSTYISEYNDRISVPVFHNGMNRMLPLSEAKKIDSIDNIFNILYSFCKSNIFLFDGKIFQHNLNSKLFLSLDGKVTYICGYIPISCSKEYIVQESTGLFDKNGVEIFEGDIVNDTYRNEIYKVKKAATMPVLLLESNQNGCQFIDEDLASNDLEVIGNIFTYEI